ncbi:hypothetical protein F2841_11690 [Bacteroides fragilis]|jgi:rRNA-processing protein FCF1|uniref:Uncharacterized protein n=1 Tax=Bacteroides fragilis (strain YCH46) TaxID=295405 RepID=Q650A9_BACFR|nr:hypothetical protein F2841_11690 [Bacteroides fragilis]BAD46917.1 hypothetical protein BF0168 [Bacteroides fragilis YCH46]KAA4780356.1 hypothetical protein F3B22_10975 [Bacteroides fragilis]KAA4788057.1 hypothetical protein F2047_18810 [Bacteroides fragilis]KAA4793654.1 hypothetical protein F3B21_03535 [Bacteroides fragilis]
MPAASEEETHSIGTFFIKAPVSESVGIRRGARTNYQKGTIFLSERSICSQITAYSKNQKGNRRILKHRILSLMQNPAIFITSTGERAEINDSEWLGKAKSQNDNIHRRATKSKPDLWVTNDIYLRKAVESAVNTSCDPP